ncbi:hypothetical protein A9Q84_10200 [Halobacteriovorax marinus]|uniref:Tail specific protease domain-containing protein n=1 Tax=Halobacteriovorax marinus TaxID=97084 RepID=A0A1Y5F7J3_9BACT|nr:hypothetical protein A9Q84_10200 [Halobacteriovorax marinus]
MHLKFFIGAGLLKFYFLFVIFIITSCSTTTSLTYKNLQWDGSSSARIVPWQKMDIKADIALLKYALDKAYVGSDFINNETWSTFSEKIDLAKNMKFEDNVEFCKYLGRQFLELPDGHFDIWFPGHSCYLPNKSKPNVGSNYGYKLKKEIFVFKEFSSKKAALLSIKRFPHHEDKKWNGFTESLSNLKKSNNIIIDLRGNGGGDSRRGLELARSLVNSTIEHNRKKIIRKNTPESWTIFRNGVLRSRIWKQSQKLPVQHLDDYIKSIDEDREISLSSSEKFLIYEHKKPSLTKLNFNGNIYVIIDRKCGSSCEHTLEALKFHPNTKSIGQNTSGAIHYGQMGVIRLPSSGIYLKLATQYFELFDDGFYEKTGYSPDISVPAGSDALSFLLDNIIKE